MNPFAATVRSNAGVAVLTLSGQLDGRADAAMSEAFEEAATTVPTALLLDFARVDYINSTGIALVVGLLAKARAAQVPVLACGLSDHYQHIFEITRLADFLTFFPDEEAAVIGASPVA